MEAEVAEDIGAERYERNAERVNQRNGNRERRWDTRVGTLDLKIPKLRKGSYFPSLLEPRKRAEKALLSAVQERTYMALAHAKWMIWSRHSG